MRVKDLQEELKKFNENDVVVIRSRTCSWICYEEFEEIKKKMLRKSGRHYEEEIYDEEPRFPIKVVVIE